MHPPSPPRAVRYTLHRPVSPGTPHACGEKSIGFDCARVTRVEHTTVSRKIPPNFLTPPRKKMTVNHDFHTVRLCAHVLAMPGWCGTASQLDLKFSHLTVFAPRCWGRRGARTRPVLNSRSILETGNPGAPDFFPILIAQILRVNLQLYSFSNRRLPHDFPY